jgi:hypothetical protein
MDQAYFHGLRLKVAVPFNMPWLQELVTRQGKKTSTHVDTHVPAKNDAPIISPSPSFAGQQRKFDTRFF